MQSLGVAGVEVAQANHLKIRIYWVHTRETIPRNTNSGYIFICEREQSA
jgi:hypothetical protein